VFICGFILFGGQQVAFAQTPLESIPGYNRYKRIEDNLDKFAVGGRISRIKWSEDGTSLTFRRLDKDYRFDLANRELAELKEEEENNGDDADTQPASRPWERAGVGRGPQRGRVR
jgi:hypothetical protein